MTARLATALSLGMLLAAPTYADTTLVDENFNSYADTAAFEAAWRPDLGQGDQPTAGPKGLIVPNTGLGLTPPYDSPPGIQGNGVNIFNQINEYNGPNAPMLANLVPTATQNIRLTGDLFDAGIDTVPAEKRASIGLRNDTVSRGTFGVFGWNFIELGFWNALATDPFSTTDPPATLPSTGFAYRVALFGGGLGGGIVREPNWQYFPLDPMFDRPDDVDPITGPEVDEQDIGPGWHTYTAEIGTTSVTLKLDLFRDGLKNSPTEGVGAPVAGVGTPGVDSEVTWIIAPHNDATEPNPFDPFNSLRIGGPSGVTGNEESVVDNIKVELVDIVVPPADDADFDGDGDIDGADFLNWQRNLGATGTGTLATGDANEDMNVDGADLDVWESQFVQAPPAAATASAVPEPATLALSALALLAALSAARRR